jgi:hypothetical protein
MPDQALFAHAEPRVCQTPPWQGKKAVLQLVSLEQTLPVKSKGRLLCLLRGDADVAALIEKRLPDYNESDAK